MENLDEFKPLPWTLTDQCPDQALPPTLKDLWRYLVGHFGPTGQTIHHLTGVLEQKWVKVMWEGDKITQNSLPRLIRRPFNWGPWDEMGKK